MGLKQAYEAGRAAWKQGRHSAPALNSEFVAAACASDEKTALLLTAYIKGWHTENMVSA